MNKTALALMLGMSTLAACATPENAREGRGETANHLNATDGLWPLTDGAAKIPVCWATPIVDPKRYPDARFAPSAALAEKKEWVREMAAVWNAQTPIEFVGWKDCSAVDEERFVRITPIDSRTRTCEMFGQPCAEGIGTRGRGKRVFLNLSFGDEVIYQSRVSQAGAPDVDLAPIPESEGLYWLPKECMTELRNPWFTTSSDPELRKNINDPAVLADAHAIIERCAKANVLHELGHVAGFAHEQYRTDDEPARQACQKKIVAAGIVDDLANVAPENRGTKPLGAFDAESIMSYCRDGNEPILTPADVAFATRVYNAGEEGAQTEDPQDGADGIGTSGGIGGKGGKAGASL